LPMSNRFFGFQTENDLLFIIVLLLANITGFSLSLCFAEEPESRFSITYQSRLLLLVFLVLVVSFTTILVYFKYNNFTSIISTQANYFGGFIPRWMILISPLHLINGISCYLILIILTQILLQYNRPIPIDFTNIFPLSKKPFLAFIQAAWKFSLLIIISLIWIILYSGAFLSPFNNTINLASTTGQLFWFLLKVIIFWSIIVTVNRKIPDLISEQILKLGYWYILPMQMILLMLTVLIKFSS
jgi:NADH:ubiquinone oxidoreductase subunit H